jgi:dihydrofolate synthase/folylpolyglutamate synthase
MTYRQTLDWMFARLPMYQLRGAEAYHAKLEPSFLFADYLGNPHTRFKSIHVAGTNGKGSSSHMLASVLQEAGYKVGLYTSPHLKDFRERIRIDGQPVTEDFVVGFIGRHKAYLEKAGLSFFEMTVGMAFAWFAEQAVDLAVVEVGMGGRLDATNIIRPEVCLITNIGLDHTEFLGTTLPQIAGEKAGIIKEGVPVVISETQPETAPVFREVAAEKQAPVTFADQMELPHYKTSLLGDYQQRNIKGVLAALQVLPGFSIRDEAIRRGLLKVTENTGLLGRWQQLRERPRVICDTAHNREGLELVMRQLARQSYRELHLVLGFVKEKKLEQLLPIFPKEALYYITRPNIPRGMDLDLLEQAFREAGLNYRRFDRIDEAYGAALETANPDDLIFVGGSTFTVAEVV